MNRITKKNLLNIFAVFCQRMGEDFELEYNACYGGYIVYSKNGSWGPFGSCRMKLKEMYQCLHFSVTALDHLNIKKSLVMEKTK